MAISISREQARRLLAIYHFRPTTITGVFERLGTVQYDPLNPVGRNPDLVLQARVPHYRIDDWQKTAYDERFIYDAWDKQACLVPISDWPYRERIRTHHRPYHDSEILQQNAEVVQDILTMMDQKGPLSSHDFTDRSVMTDGNSWYGQTLARRILRSLWACGNILTHHRRAGRHYYDRPERIIPLHHYIATVPDEESYYQWILFRRFQAVGLLRPITGDAAIWSACGNAAQRKRALQSLIEMEKLVPVDIGEQRWRYYAPQKVIKLLDQPLSPEPQIRFLAPLDSILWDRKSILQLFNFDYIWEVYKPEAQRRWGYYVLPVFYGDRFIARLDSRLVGSTWTIKRWWWETDVIIDATLLDALTQAARQFLQYLGADTIQIDESVPADASTAFLKSFS